MPSDLQNVDRDVFNEKPSKEDIIAVPEGQGKILKKRSYVSTLLTKSFFNRIPKALQFRHSTHDTWRYSLEIVWY